MCLSQNGDSELEIVSISGGDIFQKGKRCHESVSCTTLFCISTAITDHKIGITKTDLKRKKRKIPNISS